MDRVKRIWYLPPMRAAKVQASLRIHAVSPELSLLAHTSSESRGTFRQKIRSLAPLNGWACTAEICNDGMLEDTNSLDGVHMVLSSASYTLIPKSRLYQVFATKLCWLVGWLCWGLTSQSTIFQSCWDGAIASWVINQYFRGVKCLAQGHNTATVGLEPRTSRSGVRHSTTEPPRSPAKLCKTDRTDTQYFSKIVLIAWFKRQWNDFWYTVNIDFLKFLLKMEYLLYTLHFRNVIHIYM